MSKVLHLGKDYEELPKILDQFTQDLKPAEEQLEKEGKLLETSLSKNSSICITMMREEYSYIRWLNISAWRLTASVAIFVGSITKFIHANLHII